MIADKQINPRVIDPVTAPKDSKTLNNSKLTQIPAIEDVLQQNGGFPLRSVLQRDRAEDGSGYGGVRPLPTPTMVPMNLPLSVPQAACCSLIGKLPLSILPLRSNVGRWSRTGVDERGTLSPLQVSFGSSATGSVARGPLPNITPRGFRQSLGVDGIAVAIQMNKNR